MIKITSWLIESTEPNFVSELIKLLVFMGWALMVSVLVSKRALESICNLFNSSLF